MYCPFPSKTIFQGKSYHSSSAYFGGLWTLFQKFFDRIFLSGIKKATGRAFYAPPVALFFLKLQFRSAL